MMTFRENWHLQILWPNLIKAFWHWGTVFTVSQNTFYNMQCHMLSVHCWGSHPTEVSYVAVIHDSTTFKCYITIAHDRAADRNGQWLYPCTYLQEHSIGPDKEEETVHGQFRGVSGQEREERAGSEMERIDLSSKSSHLLLSPIFQLIPFPSSTQKQIGWCASKVTHKWSGVLSGCK